MSIPSTIKSGDTLKFNDKYTSYPSPVWDITYTIISADNKYTLTGIADGTSGFDFTVPHTVTSTYSAGNYSYTAHVTNEATNERYEVASGTLVITPDLSTLNTYDGRIAAQKILEAVDAILENRATVEQESYTIAGRSLKKRSLTELLALREHMKREVSQQEVLNKTGRKSFRPVHVRFKR